MSKKGISKKNLNLTNLAIVIAIIAVCGILLSSSLVRTILMLVGAVTVLLFIGKKIDKVKK